MSIFCIKIDSRWCWKHLRYKFIHECCVQDIFVEQNQTKTSAFLMPASEKPRKNLYPTGHFMHTRQQSSHFLQQSEDCIYLLKCFRRMYLICKLIEYFSSYFFDFIKFILLEMDSIPLGWIIKIENINQFAKYCTKFLIRNVNVNWMNVILDSISKKSFETWNEWWCLVNKKRWNFGNFWWKCASIAIKSHVFMNAML